MPPGCSLSTTATPARLPRMCTASSIPSRGSSISPRFQSADRQPKEKAHVRDSQIDDRTTVLALLQMSGMTPMPEEVDVLVASYPATRQMVASLYTMPGVRYEEPAMSFDPRVVTP